MYLLVPEPKETELNFSSSVTKYMVVLHDLVLFIFIDSCQVLLYLQK